MKFPILIFLLFCLVSPATAQEGFVVYSIEGKALHTAEGQKRAKVQTGQTLAANGQLKVKKRSSVGVFHQNSTTYLTGPLEVDLSELTNNDNFTDGVAANMLSRQLDNSLYPAFADIDFGFAGTPTQPGTQLPKKKEVSGGGDKTRAIAFQAPLVGKLSGQEALFEWKLREPTKAIATFELTIMDEAKKELYRAEINGNSTTVNLTAAGIKPGAKYTWNVAALTDKTLDTGPVAFTYVSATQLQTDLGSLKSDATYQTASPASQLIMEAAALEYFGYLDAANKMLADAKKKFKKDQLVRMAHNSLIFRYELR